jgi:hypothetical protein
VREETRQVTCAHCKQPITKEQQPAVLLDNGLQVHLGCWNDYQKAQRGKAE